MSILNSMQNWLRCNSTQKDNKRKHVCVRTLLSCRWLLTKPFCYTGVRSAQCKLHFIMGREKRLRFGDSCTCEKPHSLRFGGQAGTAQVVKPTLWKIRRALLEWNAPWDYPHCTFSLTLTIAFRTVFEIVFRSCENSTTPPSPWKKRACELQGMGDRCGLQGPRGSNGGLS